MNEKDTPQDDAPIEIFSSKYKLGFLALLGMFAAAMSAQGLFASGDFGSGDATMQIMGVFIGFGITVYLLNMAFDKKPTLRIDHDGITCRRPDLGLVPWHAVVGLGISRVSILRSIMLIAVDPEQVPAEDLARWKKLGSASSFMNPNVSRFQNQMPGMVSLQVPVSFLNISAKNLQKLIEEKVHRVDNQNSSPLT